MTQRDLLATETDFTERRSTPSAVPRLEVAVLIVCYNGRRFLEDCLRSVLSSQDKSVLRRVIVIDNASTDGSADWLAAEFPQIDVIRSGANLGFAGGNNLGWEFIRRRHPDVQFLALLNQDTIVRSGWLGTLAEFLDDHPTAGIAQPKVMLHPQTDRFNTVGNVSHFLGFGFVTGYNERDVGQYDHVANLGFASGAAMMVRVDAIRRVGLFDEMFFAYLEDADLSWKLRQIGYDVVYVPDAVIYHKYQFKRDFNNYFLLERNRWWLLATYYKTGTLLLLLPALIVMEAGQFYFAWRQEVLRDKLRACAFFFDRAHAKRLLAARRAAQRRRRIDDQRFTQPFIGSIEFAELSSRLLSGVANPFFRWYWAVARRLIVW